MEYVYNTSSPPLTVNKFTCKCICIWMNELALHELNKLNTTTIPDQWNPPTNSLYMNNSFVMMKYSILTALPGFNITNTIIQKQKRFCIMII